MAVKPIQDTEMRPLGIAAGDDLIGGLAQWRLWGRLGWREVQRRYSRTIIGPFWSAISLGMFVIALGAVGTGLWDKAATDYLPFLAAGMVVWVMVSSTVIESCALFVSGANLFRQMQFNYSVLAYALVWRNFIVFAHNFSIFIIIFLAFKPSILSPATFLVFPSLIILLLNAVWISLLLGLLCLRFRDVQQLVSSLIQIAMFVTPIFWPPDKLTGPMRLVFVDLNPLYHLIDIVRTPLLGSIPAAESYIASIVITLLGWTVTYFIFSRFRKRVAYWA